LTSLSYYYGIRGTLGVIDGREGAWDDIDRSVAYQFWGVRVAAGCTFKRLKAGQDADSIRLYHELPVAASLFCYAVVHELHEWQKQIWRLLTKAISTPGAVNPVYWRDQGSFELFVLRRFEGTAFAGREFRWPDYLQSPDLGPYWDVINHWDHPSDFPQALRQICDYHCQNLEQLSHRDPRPPFIEPPFDLMPYEVLAIRKLRISLGLEMPEIDHPLMATPLAVHDRPFTAPYSDDVLNRVEELYFAQVSIQ
jgi:hypothetical protein